MENQKMEVAPIIAAMMLFILFAAMFTIFMNDGKGATTDIHCISKTADECAKAPVLRDKTP